MEAFPTRYTNLASARARFGDRVDRLGPFLYRVDDAADRAIEAIETLPRGEGWRLFEAGVQRGPTALGGAPRELRALIEEAAEPPPWVDWQLFDHGGELLLRAGLLGGAVLGAGSLVLGYASPGGNKPLVFSGRLKEQAGRRVSETARFVQAVARPGGMRPFADGWQISLKVRLMHAQVRRMILRSGRWNRAAWGEPVNQHDMAGTCLLFSVTILDGLRKLGLRIEAEEAEAYAQLWRWTGRVLGVHPDVLPVSEADGNRLAALIAHTQGEPDQDSRELTQAFFGSMYGWCKTPRDRQQADRQVAFLYMLSHELLGPELANKLGVPRTTLRYAMPMLRRFVHTAEQVRLRVPLADRGAVAAGARYWDRVLALGLQGATAEFGLPERLHAA